MDKLIARIQALLNHVPGPGKILFGGLTADRQAFRSLAACLLAIVAINLMPPVISLGSAPIEQGLRQVGSGVPILVAANYLLLAILTLAAGATGDGVGRKLFLLIGLGGVLCAALASMFWLGTDGFIYADLLLSVARITITPMCIAIAAFAFGPGVRPFAFGAIFSTQAIALGSSSALYSVLRSVGNGAIVFLPPIVLGVIAFWLILRRVYEPAEQQRIVWRELLVNLLWAGAVFLAVYGLVAYAGGLTSRNALLTIAVGLGGLILAYRYFYRKLRRRGEIKLYNGRGLAFAILAGMALAMVQATFFYQFWSYFADVRRLGPVATTLQFAPFVLGMLVGTLIIVRLSTRFGARRLIAGGLVLSALGLLALSRIQVDTPLAFLILPIALLGLGLGISGPARTSVIISAPPPRLIGSGAAINSAAGQSGYALGVIVSSFSVTMLADGALRTQLRQANLPANVTTQIESAWKDAFARALSGTYTRLPPEAAQWATTQFGPAFTIGLTQTLLIMAGFVTVAAIVIFVGMPRGLQGSLITPPQTLADTPEEPQATA
ncbi:MFS transporter [Caldilinea sp.]|uniref:MFS transporter n=1 Tax=Caldilinea sp. TaxID=2293560 RepID=UPI002C1B3EE8|nr:MFS transporter [Caldilinea sp.]